MGAGDFYVSSRQNKYDDFAWETPVSLGPTVNSILDEYGPSGFENEGTDDLTLYFNSNRPGGLGGYDIYTTRTAADGTFLPVTLVTELSSAGDDTFPAVSRRDGLELFLLSNRTGTLGGFDLWSARRDRTSDAWSVPENLGPTVNSTANEQRPTISWFGNSLTFPSDRGTPNDSNLFETFRNIPAVATMAFDVANVRTGGSFTATLSGTNLTDKTYFDVRFRRPSGTADEVVVNWQQGTSISHTLPGGTETGSWIITGVRAHQDVNDRTGPFAVVSATLNIVSF